MEKRKILVTGGAGFIGQHFIRQCPKPVVNIDNLSLTNYPFPYSGEDEGHTFVCVDINQQQQIFDLLVQNDIQAVIHFAACTHVDDSIRDAASFIQSNIQGTYAMLEACRCYWQDLSDINQQQFRFLHVSTDEVYGSLTLDELPYDENASYQPNNPYSASKAASDHLVRAWHQTYGLPVITTHCSNNFGPCQHIDKFIPVVITRALKGLPIPVYGNGENCRDWLFVRDHCYALQKVLESGRVGEIYNIGAGQEYNNNQIAAFICNILDDFKPSARGSYCEQLTFVADRPGHDFRYALNIDKIYNELHWEAQTSFSQGLQETVLWYLNWMEEKHDKP